MQIDIILQIANRHMQSGRLDVAETMLKQLLANDSTHASAASAALAELYTKQQKYDAAIDVLNDERAKKPDCPNMLTRLATVYKNWGRFDEAKACYRRAIALDAAEAPRLHLALATTCRISEHDEDVRAMEAAYVGSENIPATRRFLAFALGKAMDDLRRYDQAFQYFLEANEIVAASNQDPLMEARAEEHEKIKSVIGSSFVSRYAGEGIADDAPIFVTGMPRSGTTLVEQILASHPTVHGGGEGNKLTRKLMSAYRSIGQVFPDGFDTVAPDTFRNVARDFVDGISRGKPRTTNKNLANYIWIGWIRAFLPNAKIIICKRDPRDIGISSFQLDLGRGYPWSYKLEWIGQQYRAFHDLTSYWARCFHNQIHFVQYEDLISNPEQHIRALLKYCDLEFDPACLESHKLVRVVTTSSRAQVREPIYSSSVGRWKNYEKHLEPLLSSLVIEAD